MNRGRNNRERRTLTLSFLPSHWWRLCTFHWVQRKSFFSGAKTPGQACPGWASWKCATAPWRPVEEESTSRWGGDLGPQQLLRTPRQVPSLQPRDQPVPSWPGDHRPAVWPGCCTSNSSTGKCGGGQGLCLCAVQFELLQRSNWVSAAHPSVPQLCLRRQSLPGNYVHPPASWAVYSSRNKPQKD